MSRCLTRLRMVEVLHKINSVLFHFLNCVNPTVLWVVPVARLLCTYSTFPWTPTHGGSLAMAVLMRRHHCHTHIKGTARNSRHVYCKHSSAHGHITLFCCTSRTKHKFKANIIKNFKRVLMFLSMETAQIAKGSWFWSGVILVC